MPTENRNIFFAENEVMIALMQFSAKKGLDFNIENIKEYILKEESPISIYLKVFDVKEGKIGKVGYAYPEIAAALMGYCMQLKIPLLKAGKKSLQLKNNQLYLNIKIQ